MFWIFSGERRGLDLETDETVESNATPAVWLHADVGFRDYIHFFKGAKLHVFMAISLHMNKATWAWPSLVRLCKQTGYTRTEVSSTITELSKLMINGHRLLMVIQQRDHGRFRRNVYKPFPMAAEIFKYETVGVPPTDEELTGKVPFVPATPDEIAKYGGKALLDAAAGDATSRKPVHGEKPGNQGVSPRPGFPNTDEPDTENRARSRVSIRENQHQPEAGALPDSGTPAAETNGPVQTVDTIDEQVRAILAVHGITGGTAVDDALDAPGFEADKLYRLESWLTCTEKQLAGDSSVKSKKAVLRARLRELDLTRPPEGYDPPGYRMDGYSMVPIW